MMEVSFDTALLRKVEGLRPNEGACFHTCALILHPCLPSAATVGILESIMVTTLGNQNGVVLNCVNQPMLFVDATRPETCKVMFERFWLADSLEWGTLDAFQKRVDALKRGSILCLPEQVIVPSLIREFNRHPATALFAVRLVQLTAQLIP